MTAIQQIENPEIKLIEGDGDEVTLLIEDGQAMQGWEKALMWESAEILCKYGSEFLEVGLGLGISALRIAEQSGHSASYRNRKISQGDRALPRAKPITAASAGNRPGGFF